MVGGGGSMYFVVASTFFWVDSRFWVSGFWSFVGFLVVRVGWLSVGGVDGGGSVCSIVAFSFFLEFF